jgi:hypothetical protein
MPGRVGIKVGNMMRSRHSEANAFGLFMPSGTVRHNARLWEENG